MEDGGSHRRFVIVPVDVVGSGGALSPAIAKSNSDLLFATSIKSVKAIVAATPNGFQLPQSKR